VLGAPPIKVVILFVTYAVVAILVLLSLSAWVVAVDKLPIGIAPDIFEAGIVPILSVIFLLSSITVVPPILIAMFVSPTRLNFYVIVAFEFTLPTTSKLPEASSFILLTPPVAKYIEPFDSVTVQLPKSTVEAFTVPDK
jgi:hypothetical protein